MTAAAVFTHILAPTDGSERSHRSVQAAIDLARALGARVTLFTALPPAPITIDEYSMSYFDTEAYGQALQSLAAQRLSAGLAYARSQGVEVTPLHVVDPRPAESILHAAEGQGCDAICMASHGRRGVTALVLGSETQKVLTHSKLPVLVLR